jgi:hypothetical protein
MTPRVRGHLQVSVKDESGLPGREFNERGMEAGRAKEMGESDSVSE